ncbi:MAG: TonB-dependent receptor [Bacteroidota bacterium]
MLRLLLPLAFVLSTISLFAQTQTIKGSIIDQQSEMPLIGAAVELLGNENVTGTVTDIDGYFRLEGVPIGRQVIQVTYLGYEPLTVPNIVVNSGKEVILQLAMEEAIAELDAVVVTATVDKDKAQNELATISARTFSVEEVNRYSGGNSDVARLVSNFAGVSTANDSRNDIVIRGNSPTGVLWRIEGIPIPNPNHFSTLGTTGGPVSALNPNLLRNSDFLTSAFPAEYGNALAGVFDLGLRNGNRDRHEFMLQLGAFSGLEGMAEGPLFNGGSYAVAGRYSFVGLASELGIPVGTNATPNYQDLTFKLDFGNTKAGKFVLFGIGGQSDIDFLSDEVDEDDLFAAADEDAFAVSSFGVLGLRHNLILSDKAYLRTVIAGSTSENTFTQERYFLQNTEEEFSVPYGDVDNLENRYSISSYVNKKFNARLTARAGILAEIYDYDLNALDAEEGPDEDGDGVRELVTVYQFQDQATILQPFVQTQYRFNKAWTLNAGLHMQYLDINSSTALEPRLALNWDFAPRQTLSLGYGMHSQTQPIPILLATSPNADGTFSRPNEDLDFTRSQHFVLGYDFKFAADWRLKAEAYYQDVSDVPVDPFASSFSILNTGADFIFPRNKFGLVNEGTGENYGVELTLEKFFSKNYYALVTASIYDSRYTGSDGVERSTAFNNSYVLNVLAGREWNFGPNKRHAFTIDTKITTAGGRPFTPTDLEASREAGFQVDVEELAFSETLDSYFRWDLKLGVALNSDKRKLSHRFYLDFQNLTNQENIFVRRYNRQTNEVNDVFQRGFFPDFLYRVQF